MSAFSRLSTAELAGLASALRSGRLSAPFTETAVRRFCGPDVLTALAVELVQLNDKGLNGPAIGYTVEAVAHERVSRATSASEIELVWSGPEAPGIANRDTAAVVRELFGSAKQEVLVVGFAVYQGKSIFQRLVERMVEFPGLRVQLYLDVRRQYGDTTASSELIWKFVTNFRTKEWPGTTLPELYFDPRSLEVDSSRRSSLHAKCVVVDRQIAFVTSANFTEAAHHRNVEVGCLIRSAAFAADLARHFEVLRSAGLLAPAPNAGT